MGSWPHNVYDRLVSGVRFLASDGLGFAANAHSRIHQGRMFSVSHIETGVADDASLDLVVISSASKFLHIRASPAASAAAEFYVYEDVSVDGGSVLTPVNHKRYSSNTFDGSVVYNPVENSLGDLLHESILPGGQHNRAVGASADFEDEWDLLASTPYMFRVTNKSGGAADLSMSLIFYYTTIQISDS